MAPPLEITLKGQSSQHRNAERASISIDISSVGTDQKTVFQDIVAASNTLQKTFKELSPKTETGEATPDAAITVFTTSNVSSGSYVPEKKDSNDEDEPARRYTTSCKLQVTFRDFGKLSEICSQLLQIPEVTLSSVTWRLTEATRLQLVREVRREALRDAIRQANDYAEIVGREVFPVQISQAEHSIPRGRIVQAPRRRTARVEKPETNWLQMEPEEVVVDASVSVKFATEG